MTLERSTIFGFREEKDKYSMRKHGSCSSFDRQSFDHSGHSLFGVESVASDTDGSPIKDKDGVRPAPSMSSPAYSARGVAVADGAPGAAASFARYCFCSRRRGVRRGICAALGGR